MADLAKESDSDRQEEELKVSPSFSLEEIKEEPSCVVESVPEEPLGLDL